MVIEHVPRKNKTTDLIPSTVNDIARIKIIS